MHMQIDGERVRLNPRDPHFYNNPYPYYEALRQSAPAFYWEDFDLWCYVNHEDVNALFRDRRLGRQITHLKTREELGWPPIREDLQTFYRYDDLSMIQQEPPNHTRLRGLVQKAFMARQIEGMRPRIRQLCNQLLDEVQGAGEFDLLARYATPVPVIVIAEMLGVPAEMSPSLLQWSHAMVAMYELGRSSDQEKRAVQATLDFSDYIRSLVKERRIQPKNDLITLLIEAEEQGEKLTEDELVSSVMQLLNAGHEATVNVVGNGVFALMQQRDQWDALVSDPNPALARSTVEELLRFDTPLHLFSRFVLEDGFTYKGKTYAFGQQVALLLGAADRDPKRFVNADQLNIRRPVEDNPHVSFGGGIHFCVGAPLARIELQESISALAQRMPNLQLVAQPEYRNAYHFHGLKELKVAS